MLSRKDKPSKHIFTEGSQQRVYHVQAQIFLFPSHG